QDPKLRTVIWDFAGQPLPGPIVADLRDLKVKLGGESPLSQDLAQLLSDREMVALGRRLERLIRTCRFPEPGPGRSVPWPLV
ncbi:MAG: hypothetical protein PVJ34_19885, partial [Anaerolineae bacterium]